MYDDRTVELGRTLFLIDIILTICTFVLAVWIRVSWMGDGDVNFISHLYFIPLLLALVVGFLSYFDAYKGPSEMSAIKYIWAVFRAFALSIGVLLALLFLLHIQYVSRVVIIGFSGLAFLALAVVRVGVRRYFHSIHQSRYHLHQGHHHWHR
jgi:FlaA1/EpsC-like NDP-sugar epimerase